MARLQTLIREARRGIASASEAQAPPGAVSGAEFRRVYAGAVEQVLGFLTARMQGEIAAHNRAWDRDQTDFRVYLEASWVRYFRCYARLAAEPEARSVCDVGGFWGAFPVTLRRLGYRVTMTEALRFYSRTFDGLFDFIRSEGVEIVDYDPFGPTPPGHGTHDFTTAMAVLEHYPHSLAGFMGNVVRMTAPGGRVYLEVPNIAFWPKRVALLLGRTPLVPLRQIWVSGVPFIGHHHEFTLRELRDLADLAGLNIEGEEAFNYTPGFELAPVRFLRHPLRSLAFLLRPDCREILALCCRRATDQG